MISSIDRYLLGTLFIVKQSNPLSLKTLLYDMYRVLISQLNSC